MSSRQHLYSRRKAMQLMAMTTAGIATPPLLSGCSVNPVTGEKQLMLMSESQELALDRKHAPQQFSNDYGSIQNKALNHYIAEVGGAMASTTHRPKVPYNYRAVNATHVNAYTFPAGSMAITRGILLEMENESELAGLLGHELGHVNARHAAQRQTRSLFTKLALAGAGMASSHYNKTAGMLVSSLGGIASKALLASYSRDDERQADALGMQYMARSGHNPEGMVGLMELLSEKSKHKPNALETMFSTHPMSRARMATAKRRFTNSYRTHGDAPLHRTRYMDHTASVRAQRQTIELIQKADEALGKKQVKTAERYLRSALKKDEDDYTALLKMAKVQLAKGNKQDAKHFADLAKQAYPQEAQALHVAAIVNLTQGNPAAARSDLQAYEQRLPGNPQTLFLHAQALDDMNQKRSASRYYLDYLRTTRQGAYAQHAQQRLLQWGVLKPR
ncbi:M48 family metalloprotease [Magnetococcus sp. PR-3]|uniref:M48 family metalloprotease n=1 Tax=Magnetococcus sp. PR-3 TaxID=3120355 RepID=UPI002FCE65F9